MTRYKTNGKVVWDNETDSPMTPQQIVDALNRYHEANEPVTGEWLESLGFELDENRQHRQWRHVRYRIEVLATGSGTLLWYHCGQALKPNLNTRGQLLDYIRILDQVKQSALTEEPK